MGVVVFVHKPGEFDGGVTRGKGSVLAWRVSVGVNTRTIDAEISTDVAEERANVGGREIGIGGATEGGRGAGAETLIGSRRERRSGHPY